MTDSKMKRVAVAAAYLLLVLLLILPAVGFNWAIELGDIFLIQWEQNPRTTLIRLTFQIAVPVVAVLAAVKISASIRGKPWEWTVGNAVIVGFLATLGTIFIANFVYPESLKELASALKTSPMTVLLNELQPFGVVAGAFVVLLVFFRFRADEQERRDDLIARSWGVIAAQPGEGSRQTGAREALEVLHRQGISLERISIDSAVMTGLDLSPHTSRPAKLREAWFRRSDLIDAKFTDADLTKATFESCEMDRVTFSNANLTGALFRDIQDARCKFTGTALSDAQFVHVVLIDVDLSRINFVQNKQPKFSSCYYAGTIMLPGTVTPAMWKIEPIKNHPSYADRFSHLTSNSRGGNAE